MDFCFCCGCLGAIQPTIRFKREIQSLSTKLQLNPLYTIKNPTSIETQESFLQIHQSKGKEKGYSEEDQIQTGTEYIGSTKRQQCLATVRLKASKLKILWCNSPTETKIALAWEGKQISFGHVELIKAIRQKRNLCLMKVISVLSIRQHGKHQSVSPQLFSRQAITAHNDCLTTE